jgi:hypothetical protein
VVTIVRCLDEIGITMLSCLVEAVVFSVSAQAPRLVNKKPPIHQAKCFHTRSISNGLQNHLGESTYALGKLIGGATKLSVGVHRS